MLNLGDDRYTFSLAGQDWPLTDHVKAYLEWVAIEVNYLYEEDTSESLYWEDDQLYFKEPESDEEDPEVLSPDAAIESVFGDVSEENIWGWILGCNLTKWPPTNIEHNKETVSATRHRISEVVVWRLTAGRDVSDELKDFTREVLSQYSDEKWETSLAEDSDLAIAKEKLDL